MLRLSQNGYGWDASPAEDAAAMPPPRRVCSHAGRTLAAHGPLAPTIPLRQAGGGGGTGGRSKRGPRGADGAPPQAREVHQPVPWNLLHGAWQLIYIYI